MTTRVRLDTLLAQRGLFPSRARAAASVMAGEVRLGPGHARAANPGQMVASDAVIEIDEALCDGCGQCVTGCAEGALQIVDGKARVVSETFCDGLGACIGECPIGALRIVEREAPPFDEAAAQRHLADLLVVERGDVPTSLGQEVEWRPLAPLAPGKIVAIGLNYLDHVRETGMERPQRPLMFATWPSSVIGTDAAIAVDAGLTERVDGEVDRELAEGTSGIRRQQGIAQRSHERRGVDDGPQLLGFETERRECLIAVLVDALHRGCRLARQRDRLSRLQLQRRGANSLKLQRHTSQAPPTSTKC